MRVLLLGATGMLGSAIYDVLNKKYDLLLAVRTLDKITLLEKTYGGTGRHKALVFDASQCYQDYATKKGGPGEYMQEFLGSVGPVDCVINAIGVTIPFSLREPALTFFVNGALPHVLAAEFGERLIHITTDCVYDGRDGFPYHEESAKGPVDIYGLSKSLGEPRNCLTLRTSIIGRELNGFTGLLEWFLQQSGKTITGFSQHYWNGITTHEFGNLCDQILQNPKRFPRKGIYHVFSTVVSKYDMLQAFQRKYRVPCTIVPDEDNKLNRTLTTKKELNAMLQVPSFTQMLEALGS
jgi:dTDP-4-dehydrorhamnose reductase